MLEAYCDSMLYALVNKYNTTIKEIIDIKENISYKDFEFNFKSEML
jgi:hypothetical protein